MGLVRVRKSLPDVNQRSRVIREGTRKKRESPVVPCACERAAPRCENWVRAGRAGAVAALARWKQGAAAPQLRHATGRRKA